MPRQAPLTEKGRMNRWFNAIVDKHMRLLDIKRYGDLAKPLKIGETTARARIRHPGKMTLDETRDMIRYLHIPPHEAMTFLYSLEDIKKFARDLRDMPDHVIDMLYNK